MSRFRHAVKDRDQHIQTLRIACAVLAFSFYSPVQAGCWHPAS